MPLLASQLVLKVPARGPVIWLSGKIGEPVVRCWISNPESEQIR